MRKEANSQKPLPVEAVYALLKGGVTPYNIIQSMFVLVQRVEALVEAVKFGNGMQAQFLRLEKEISERQLRHLGSQQGGSK